MGSSISRSLSRKELLQAALGLVGAATVLNACASSTPAGTNTDSGTGGGLCKADGAKDQNLDDPKHHLVVPAADVLAGVQKTYSIQGTQTHDHQVTLQPADFAKLATDTKITVTSTTSLQHSHTFDVVCA